MELCLRRFWLSHKQEEVIFHSREAKEVLESVKLYISKIEGDCRGFIFLNLSGLYDECMYMIKIKFSYWHVIACFCIFFFPFILFFHYSFLRKMVSVDHTDVCYVALCRSLAISREATIFAGVYSSFFFHSKVFEDLLKSQVQMKFILFTAQRLLQLLF